MAIIKPANKDIFVRETDAGQLYLQAVPREGESAAGFCKRLTKTAALPEYQPVKATCFGPPEHCHEFETVLRCSLKGDFPVTWAGSESCINSFMNGIQLWMLKDVPVKYIITDFEAKGSYFSDNEGEYLFLGNIVSKVSETNSYRNLFGQLRSFLGTIGFSFSDVIRTWYYLDDILTWYGPFNEARNEFFRNENITLKKFPVSTGIGGRNRMGSAITMELFALRPKNNRISVSGIGSPVQPDAYVYGSSFSRGIKVKTGRGTWLSVSGTAGILPDGKTAFAGDFKKQANHAFEVVNKLIHNEGFTINDIIRATIYLKDPSLSLRLEKLMTNKRYFSFPVVVTGNTICRDDLFMEIEMDLYRSGLLS